MKGDFFRRDFPDLRGKTKEYLEAISRDCFERSLKADIFEQARDLVAELKAEGQRVVFATSSIILATLKTSR